MTIHTCCQGSSVILLASSSPNSYYKPPRMIKVASCVPRLSMKKLGTVYEIDKGVVEIHLSEQSDWSNCDHAVNTGDDLPVRYITLYISCSSEFTPFTEP